MYTITDYIAEAVALFDEADWTPLFTEYATVKMDQGTSLFELQEELSGLYSLFELQEELSGLYGIEDVFSDAFTVALNNNSYELLDACFDIYDGTVMVIDGSSPLWSICDLPDEWVYETDNDMDELSAQELLDRFLEKMDFYQYADGRLILYMSSLNEFWNSHINRW